MLETEPEEPCVAEELPGGSLPGEGELGGDRRRLGWGIKGTSLFYG